MRNHILKTTLLCLCMFLNSSGCTDYTKDIRGPGSSSDINSPAGSKGGESLPPHLQSPNLGEFSEEKMIANIGLNVIAKNVENLFVEVKRLKRITNEKCDAYQKDKNIEKLTSTLGAQWKSAMIAYHRVDAIPVGPLSENNSLLANSIYSWPLINTCGIDLEVARKASGSDKLTPTAALPVNKKGLGALEYLIFSGVEASGCKNLSIAINKDAADWLKRTTVEKYGDRCGYIKEITSDLEEKVTNLYNRWNPKDQNYTASFFNDKAMYPSSKVAINTLTDGMFSVETLREVKIGIPLGIMNGCGDVSGLCPDMVEHLWSGIALEAIQEQVNGFKEIFFGGVDPQDTAFGFDDYLVSKGQSELVKKFSRDIELADETLSTLVVGNSGLKELVQQTEKSQCTEENATLSVQPACYLYYSIRKISTLLKVDLLIVLALDAPPIYQGDND